MPIINGQFVEPLVCLRRELEGTGTIDQPSALPAIAGLVNSELTADKVIAFLGHLTWETMDAPRELRLAAFDRLRELLSPRLSSTGDLALGETWDDIFYN